MAFFDVLLSFFVAPWGKAPGPEKPEAPNLNGTFRKEGVPYFGVLIMRILLVRVLYSGPLFSETPISTLRAKLQTP